MPDDLSPDSYIRLRQVLVRVPVAKSAWWDGVREHRYPPAARFGPQMTAWRAGDVDLLLDLVEALAGLGRAGVAEHRAMAARVRARGGTHAAWRAEARALIERLAQREAA